MKILGVDFAKIFRLANLARFMMFALVTFSTRSASLLAKVQTDGPLASSEPMCAIGSKTVLRRGPGLKFPVSWTVAKYMPFLAVQKKGDWLKVQDLEGETHWAQRRSLSKKVNCAVVKTKTAKLRQGPGLEHPLAELSPVEKYSAFQKVDRDGEWVQIRDRFGATYWVHENNIWLPLTRMSVEF